MLNSPHPSHASTAVPSPQSPTNWNSTPFFFNETVLRWSILPSHPTPFFPARQSPTHNAWYDPGKSIALSGLVWSATISVLKVSCCCFWKAIEEFEFFFSPSSFCNPANRNNHQTLVESLFRASNASYSEMEGGGLVLNYWTENAFFDFPVPFGERGFLSFQHIFYRSDAFQRIICDLISSEFFFRFLRSKWRRWCWFRHSWKEFLFVHLRDSY